MNDRINEQLENGARSVVELLEDTARASLSPEALNPKYMKPPTGEEEGKRIKEKIKELEGALNRQAGIRRTRKVVHRSDG